MLIALVVQVHIAALLDLSYLGLCRHSPEMALRYAEELLGLGEMERVPEERSALLMGHMYAAEALCILNRPAEAAEHVSPTTVGDLMNLANASSPEPSSKSPKASCSKLAAVWGGVLKFGSGSSVCTLRPRSCLSKFKSLSEML